MSERGEFGDVGDVLQLNALSQERMRGSARRVVHLHTQVTRRLEAFPQVIPTKYQPVIGQEIKFGRTGCLIGRDCGFFSLPEDVFRTLTFVDQAVRQNGRHFRSSLPVRLNQRHDR